MANMNFGVNILPKANNTYSLGNSDYKWNLYTNSINGTTISNLVLPTVSSTDNGKILKVDNGVWAVGAAPSGLPSVSSTDNGKMLQVSNGAWAAVTYTAPVTSVNGNTGDIIITDNDEKVKQQVSTSNLNLPILFRNNTTSTSNTTEMVRFVSSVTIQPSTGNLTATKFNDYTLGAACEKGVTDNSSDTDVTSSDTNLITGRTLYYQLAKKGYTTNTGTITGITMNGVSKGTNGIVDLGTIVTSESDPVFSSSAAASITSTDISNWNAIVSDDKTWNGVTLNKGSGYACTGDCYIPYLDSYNQTVAYTGKATSTPTSKRFAKYDDDAYLHSTTPSASDNSTKVATTAYVNAAIPDVSGFYTKPSGGIPSTDLADTYIEEPSSDGTSGQVLTTNGSGGRSWTTISTYTLPPATDSALGGVKIGSNITVANDGTISVAATPSTMTGATSSANGASGLVPAPTSADVDKFLAGDGTYKSGGKPMVILSYGNSTWDDFEAAYNNNVIVYCRASSNSNPASGSQTRMAFMAYVNNATTPTEVEFQYYRSMSSHSATAMGDQVFVYKLTKTGGWSVTTRDASIKEINVESGSKLEVSWSGNKVTLSNTMTAADMPMSSSDATTVSATISALSTLPAVTSADNGKILRVVNGEWAVVSISDASGVSF